jgi:hypothetical protein
LGLDEARAKVILHLPCNFFLESEWVLLIVGRLSGMWLDVSECRSSRIKVVGNEVRAALQMLVLGECLDVVCKKWSR